MGKHFYGTHADKGKAMRIADVAAKKYKKGKCYTPSSRISNSCKFDATTNLWTCRASAHHHWGSCGSKEITSHPGTGTEWNVSFPPIIFNQQSEMSTEGQNDESVEDEYIDALPEDYEKIEDSDLAF
jgi:hypothetical protein